MRRNLVGILEARGIVPSDVYSAMGWTAARFWGQFTDRVHGPKLTFVAAVADHLGVPLWRMLLQRGEKPPSDKDVAKARKSLELSSALIRHSVRGMTGMANRLITIPERCGESDLNYLIRQNIAVGIWSAGLTESELYTELGFTGTAWRARFRRKSGVSLADLWRIAEALEMQPWELVADINTGDET